MQHEPVQAGDAAASAATTLIGSEPAKPWRSGIFYDIPEAEYHERILGVANNGGLKILRNRSPAHYKAWIEEEKTDDQKAKEKKHFKLGRIVHAAILERDRFERQYLLQPDFGPMQSSTNRKKRDDWLADQDPEAIIVDQKELDTTIAMREAIMRHKLARLIIENGKPEVTIYWTCPRTGLRCKIRIDWYVPEMGFAMDLKSTLDASPAEFARSVAKFEYHAQHCFYAGGLSAVGCPIENYLFLAAEKEAPHAVGVYHIDAAAEERGFQLIDRSMDRLAECVAANHYPAYGEDITQLTLPGWAFFDK